MIVYRAMGSTMLHISKAAGALARRYPSRMPGRAMSVIVVVVAGAVLGAAGCTPEPVAAPDATVADTPPLTADEWPYWPDAVRVHPLSRLVLDDAGKLVMIEGRIEFLDPEGDTTKAVGRLRIDLHDAEGERGLGPLLTWTVDLREPKINRERYDKVTRTYLCRLEIEPRDLPTAPELRVYFLSADNRPLNTATALLRRN